MRIGEIATKTEYRIDEQFQNCQFLQQKGFPKNIWKFIIFPIWTIPKIANLGKLKNL